jgi:hypothetical protein
MNLVIAFFMVSALGGDLVNQSRARGYGRWPTLAHTKAPIPVMALPTIRFCTDTRLRINRVLQHLRRSLRRYCRRQCSHRFHLYCSSFKTQEVPWERIIRYGIEIRRGAVIAWAAESPCETNLLI